MDDCAWGKGWHDWDTCTALLGINVTYSVPIVRRYPTSSYILWLSLYLSGRRAFCRQFTHYLINNLNNLRQNLQVNFHLLTIMVVPKVLPKFPQSFGGVFYQWFLSQNFQSLCLTTSYDSATWSKGRVVGITKRLDASVMGVRDVARLGNFITSVRCPKR